jgi:hypothetical protein
MNRVKTILSYVIGGLAIIGVGVLAITTLNRINSSKLIASIIETFFLRKKGIDRKDNTVYTEHGEIDIPEPIQDETVTAYDTVEPEIEHAEILHEMHDRRIKK